VETPAFLFLRGILFRDGVKAKNTEEVRSAANFFESGVELVRRFGYEIEEELIDPGRAVNRAAFDFHQIDGMACERLERGEERAGLVRKAQSDGHFQ